MSGPILFLDVDGPLIPFGGTPQERPGGYPTYRSRSVPLGAAVNPLLARLDPALGPRLAALPCDLVWATSWMEEANESIAPLLGLHALPVALWSDSLHEEADVRAGLHWKTRVLVTWAAGRPFAWVDDEITDGDRSWVAAHHQAPALLHRVDPCYGLTNGDFAVLARWAELNQSAGQANLPAG